MSPEPSAFPLRSSELPVPPALYTQDLLLTFAGDEYAEFLTSRGRQLRPRLVRALELGDLSPGMHVLDVGCGRGEIALHAARRGASVTAIDFSRDCLRLTARTLELGPPAVRTRVRLVRADAAVLPIPDGSVHRVLCLDLLEHLTPWQLRLALAEIRRVLSPDGYAVIHTLPNRWALEIGYPLLRRLWPDLPAQPRSAYEQWVHVNELDPIRLARALGEAGLQYRVWLENWTMAQASWGKGRQFADPLRERVYPILRRRWMRWVSGALMRTPMRLIFANDLFAVAWREGGEAPVISTPRAWVECVVCTLATRAFERSNVTNAKRILTGEWFSGIMYTAF